jgi:hypothetical protein
MNAAYLSAVAALAGSVIGGFTSLATTWITQRGQAKLQQRIADRVKRETLFSKFIDQASLLYADAFTHEATDLAKIAELYAMISRMRLVSSKGIVDHAEKVSLTIINTYLAPNKTFRDIIHLKESGALDPLREFSEACREELRKFDAR